MPRVEIIPDGWAESPAAKRGDGTPTADLCVICHGAAVECGDGGPLLRRLAVIHPNGRFGSFEVDHPPYGQEPTKCARCNTALGYLDD